METKELQKIRELLPPQYGRIIADGLRRKDINNRTVIRVFHGEITDQAIVQLVIDKALKIIRAQNNFLAKTKKILSES